MSTAPKALVIGATGRIGRVVVDSLAADERVCVVAAVRTPQQAAEFRSRGVMTRSLDLDQPHAFDDALRGVDRVFLLTGYFVEMLVQSKAVVDAARRNGVRHIVHLGVHASPDTVVPHNTWHQLIECYIERSGMEWTHLHPNWFMQLVPWLAGEGLRQDGTLVYFIGDSPVSWVDSDDVARAAATVLADPERHVGRTYRLAHEVMNFPGLAKMLSDHFGRPYRYVDVSPDDFLSSVLERRLVEPAYARSAHRLFTELRAGRLGEAVETFGDYERITGLQPRTWSSFIQENAGALRY